MGETRQGRKIVLTGDTRPCKSVVEIARGADLLVHDSTFTGEEADRARQTMHSTAAEAAQVGKDADVKLLALTHMSFRYLPRQIIQEARGVFERIVMPNDFDRLVIPLPEKGDSYLLKAELVS
ncbi:Ribonuclease Z [compost metagenome]